MNIPRTYDAIQIDQFGGPANLHWRQIPAPALKDNEVRIRHRAIGVNYIDVYHRTGLYPLPLPFVPRIEGAGEAAQARRDLEARKTTDPWS